MSQSPNVLPGLSLSKEYYLADSASPKDVITVATTYPGPISARLTSRTAVANALPLASQMAWFVQGPLRGRPRSLAEQITKTPGTHVAVDQSPDIGGHPLRVLAFGTLRILKPPMIGRRDGDSRTYYVYEQFDVANGKDVLKRPDDPIAQRQIAAAGALILATLDGVSDTALVHFIEHPGDTRNPALFSKLGAVASPDLGQWGSGEAVMLAEAGVLRSGVRDDPSFSFLPGRPYAS